MSTTDTRAAFEALITNGPLSYLTAQRMDNGEYISRRTRAAWTAYQAATEAAKATGTAGELPPLPEAWITDCTTTDPAARLHFAADQMRTYGQACAEAARNLAIAQADYNHDMDELAQDFEPVADMDLEKAKRHIVGLRKRLKNAKANAEAARQPAPVAAQENGGLVRAALIDLMEIEQAATAGEFKQDMTFDFAKQSHYRALFARARAALAATAAPVLSDEQILQIAAAEAIDNVTDERRPDSSTIICFARAILAATNRSQP